MTTKTKIPAIKNGTFVGISNCVGAFPVIDRPRPNFYRVLFPFRGQATVIEIHRRSLTTLRPGNYLFMGEAENFIRID